MDTDEAIQKLVEYQKIEPERAHMEADDVLCLLLSELGYDSVVAEYNKVQKWYA